MKSVIIGSVKTKSNKVYQVKWNSISKEVYVSYAGWTNCGKALSSSDAMRKAEGFLYDK